MPKILIVDDEWLTRLEIEEMLTDLGYEVAGQAETGAEAVTMARGLNPDLVLMDIKMPGEMNGIDAAGEIKAELGTPIIFLSGYGDPEHIEAAKKIAPFGYVMKPFDEREVHAFVEIALSRRKLELKLEESEGKYRTLVETNPYGFQEIDSTGIISYTNATYQKMTGYTGEELSGRPIVNLLEPASKRDELREYLSILVKEQPQPTTYFQKMRTKDGRVIDVEVAWRYNRDNEGRVVGFSSIITDVTARKQAEEALENAHDELEEQVEERIAELSEINKQLREEIRDRKEGEKILKEREDDLEEKRIRLEELNAALKILLEKRDEDREELEEKVMANVKEMVLPYVAKLKSTGLDALQETFTDIIESNLDAIISPFLRKLSSKYLNFTPTELRVADLVKQGLRTKEIGNLLNSSPETISRHRKSIRKKLQLEDKKSNLRTHLLSLQ